MKYVLDTDILSLLMRNDADTKAGYYACASKPNTEIMTTIFSHSEIWYGYYLAKLSDRNPPDPHKLLATTKILQLTQEASDCFAMIKAKLTLMGRLIQDIDIFIASITMAHGGILVTNNIKHFERIDGLKLENWKKKK
jgi:tRNA(fMet)-specific endonuclease VapC